jgi:hypothetical protein
MSAVTVTRFAPSLPEHTAQLQSRGSVYPCFCGAALTGRLSGPELGPLLRAMPEGMARQRLARFA